MTPKVCCLLPPTVFNSKYQISSLQPLLLCSVQSALLRYSGLVGAASDLPVQPRHLGSCSFLMLQKQCQCFRKLHFSSPKGRLGDGGTGRCPGLSTQRLSLLLCPSALREGPWIPLYSFSSRKEGVTLPVVSHAHGRCWLSMCWLNIQLTWGQGDKGRDRACL